MNYSEFSSLMDCGWNDRTNVACHVIGCDNIQNTTKGSALNNFDRNGMYKCRSCCYTKEGKEKISKATSYKRSEKTKQRMTKAANKKWQSLEGKELKKHLSKCTAKQHARTNMDKSKRKVLYISAKNNNQIRVCNSSGEFIACEDILEKDPNVVSYETQVYYEIADRSRSLDFLVRYKNGSIKAIEVKPLKRMSEEANINQIVDSQTYAESQKWKFEVWMESHLGITNWKDATRRADEYRKTHYLIDYAAYRSEMDRKKAKRHYDSKIAQDKVIVFCEYCQDYHDPLKKTYEKAIATKGRFICEREGGHIGGSKPKKKKESPYGPDLKRCTGVCDRVLPLDSFSQGKAQCKECRAKHYAAKYQEGKSHE